MFSSRFNKFIKEKWGIVGQYTLVDLFKMGKLLEIVNEVIEIEGNMIECGSFKG